MKHTLLPLPVRQRFLWINLVLLVALCPTLSAQELCLQVSDLDFGVLHPDSSVSKALQISNEGQGTVTFDNPSGGDVITWLDRNFSISSVDRDRLKQAKLGPGQTTTITVTFTAPAQSGPYRTTARLWANTRRCRDTSVWSAVVQESGPAITGYDWGTQWVVKPNSCTQNQGAPYYEGTVNISNTGTGDFRVASIQIIGQNPSGFVLDNSNPGTTVLSGDLIKAGVGDVRAQRVHFYPTEERVYKAEIRLTATDGKIASSFLTGVGIESHGAIVSPTLGPILPGTSLTRNVELKSTGMRPLKVTGLTLSGLTTTQAYGFSFPQDFTLPTEASPWVLGAGEVKQIPVVFNPSAAGTSYAIMTYYGDGSTCDSNIDTLEGIADPSLSVAQGGIAGGLRIESNHPNPFSERTSISFSLPRAERTTIGIYNTDGARVATLVDGQLEPGEHQAVWDAAGQPSGLYYCRIDAGGLIRSHTLMLVR